MAVNEVAGNIVTELLTYQSFEEWLRVGPDAEVIDLKYSADEQEDMVLVIFRNEK